MKKFWNWIKNDDTADRTLYISGTIAEESWFDDDITPAIFKSELMSGSGDITVWINSCGGDCVAAAQIYNMLMEYNGKVTVKIDGIAASAASVIAMAGDEVLMSPLALLMIHNPLTMAVGDSDEMRKAIDILNEVKESIINAYEKKTSLSRSKISHMMDAETWMNANKAIELGFADGILFEESEEEKQPNDSVFMFSRKNVANALYNKVKLHNKALTPEPKAQRTQEKPTVTLDQLQKRLSLIKH